MKYRGINLENVKNNNRSAILHILNNNGAMSRKDIAGRTGLTAASVTLICTELLEEGIIVELGEAVEEKRAGRKKILVDINPSYKFILCISIESDETYLSVTDCKGEVLNSEVLTTDKKSKPEEFLETIAMESARLLWDRNIAKNTVMGVAVSVPGEVDREKGISINSFSIWNTPVRIADILSQKLGIPIVVENNLKTSSESEMLFGSGRTEDNFVLLKWGPGVGSSIVIDRKIYQGAGGLAAEIGHVSIGKDGRLCNCGRRGCLETEISTHAIIGDIEAEYRKDPGSMPVLDNWYRQGNKMTYKNTDQWGALRDEKMQKILSSKIDKLAFSMRNYKSLLDPGKVILMGYMFDIAGFYERFLGAVREYDDLIPDNYFVKSETFTRRKHIETLATAMNEWFFEKRV